MANKRFENGTRVRLIKWKNSYNGNLKNKVGSIEGIIKTWSISNKRYAVEFDEDFGGHSCGGYCIDCYGQWIDHEDLELIEKPSTQEIKVGSRVKVIAKSYRNHVPEGAIGVVVECDGTSVPYRVEVEGEGDLNWFTATEIALCEEPRAFKVGDRVKITVNYCNATEGMTGTIKEEETSSHGCAVEFDEDMHGHGCNGVCKHGHGLWVSSSMLELITAAPRPLQEGDRVKLISYHSYYSRSLQKHIGITGTIKKFRDGSSDEVAVEFDKHFAGSHHCQGNCDPKKGQWIYVSDLELIWGTLATKTKSKKQTTLQKDFIVGIDPSLSDEELLILSKLEKFKYIARDLNGWLFAYASKPIIDIGGEQWYSTEPYKTIPQELFSFIKWGDEPVEIKILIKGGNA